MDRIHGLEAGTKLYEAAGKMQVELDRVNGEMHTSIPSALLAKGRPRVEVLVFADMHGAPPAAEDHHLDQVWLLNIFLLQVIASTYLSWINHFERNHLRSESPQNSFLCVISHSNVVISTPSLQHDIVDIR